MFSKMSDILVGDIMYVLYTMSLCIKCLVRHRIMSLMYIHYRHLLSYAICHLLCHPIMSPLCMSPLTFFVICHRIMSPFMMTGVCCQSCHCHSHSHCHVPGDCHVTVTVTDSRDTRRLCPASHSEGWLASVTLYRMLYVINGGQKFCQKFGSS
jgi:hypothetical protein